MFVRSVDAHTWTRRAVFGLTILYAVWFSAYTCIEHAQFRTGAFDLGTFDQGIWLAGHDSTQFVTVRGLPLLGDHTRFISYLLAPLYWVWDDVRALLILQSFAIAAGAWFFYRISLQELPARPWFACVVAISYLLHPAVQNLNLDHAHPDAFAATFIISALYFLRANRLVPFWVAAMLAMLCKEDIPLVFAALGLAMMVRADTRKLGTALAGFSFAYFALCLLVILPYFNGYGFFRFSKHGNLVGLWSRGHDLVWIVDRLLSEDRVSYLLKLGLPNFYLFLLAPLSIFPALPPLAANLLSDTRHMRDLQFHYQFSIVPFFLLGTIVAIARLNLFRGTLATYPLPRMITGSLDLAIASLPIALLVASVAAQTSWSKVPLTNPNALAENWRSYRSDSDLAKIRAALGRIPAHAPVAAHYLLVPHLTHRRSVYMFPNPFEPDGWGVRGEGTHDPANVRYVVLLTRQSTPAYKDIVARLVNAGEFAPVLVNDVISLYRRRPRFVESPNSSG